VEMDMSNQVGKSLLQQTKIKKILEVLTSIIEKSSNDLNNLGLFSGLSGELLYLWQVSQHDEKLVNEYIFNEKFQFLQNNLSLAASKFNLSSGLTGLGWFFEYINQNQAEGYDTELCEDIDGILLKTLSVTPWQGEIEMVLGLAGMSIYGARRQLKSDQAVFYGKLINHFESLATQVSDNTLTWQQPQYSVYLFDKNNIEKPEYNLGLAHGVPGIIAAILPALNIPSLYARNKNLLTQSCDWLLQQQLDIKESQSYFSSSIDSKHYSRLGWCYGDLTIALTLHRVGKALELPSYIEKSIEISLHAASRDEVNGIVNDAGLCHGSAGLALIFKLLYQEIGLVELQQASDKWLDFTLKFFDDKGLAGLYKLSGIDQTHSECTGFLEGYAGIGLCLLTLLNGDDDWTDCLLLS
jgi:lantibiotic modifying enzyme